MPHVDPRHLVYHRLLFKAGYNQTVVEYKQCVGTVHGLKLNTEIIVRIVLKLVTVVACTA